MADGSAMDLHMSDPDFNSYE